MAGINEYQGTETYSIKRLDIITNEGRQVGLFNTFSSLEIVEDIFSNFLYGYVTIEDNNDLQQVAPYCGEELLYFTFNTDKNRTDADVILEFRVYRVETVDTVADKVAHKLMFISLEGYYNANNIISKSYKDRPIDFIVTDAFSRISAKPIEFTPMVGDYHIISPNWSPLQLINFTTTIAKPASYLGSMFVFYESMKGFFYKHVEELYEKDPIGIYSGKEVSKNDTSGAFGTDAMNASGDEIFPNKNISNYKLFRNSADILKSLNDGLFANRVLSYDNITKTYKENKYDYLGQFLSTRHLNEFMLVSPNFKEYNPDQRTTHINSNSHRYLSGYYTGKMGAKFLGDNKEEITTWRTTLLSQLQSRQIELEVDGYTKLVLGVVVEVHLPNAQALESRKQQKNRYNTKKMMVTKIIHTFDRKVHIARVIASDDAYPDTLQALPELDT